MGKLQLVGGVRAFCIRFSVETRDFPFGDVPNTPRVEVPRAHSSARVAILIAYYCFMIDRSVFPSSFFLFFNEKKTSYILLL